MHLLSLNQKVKYTITSQSTHICLSPMCFVDFHIQNKNGGYFSSLFIYCTIRFFNFNSSNETVPHPVHLSFCPIRSSFYFLTIWMTSSCSMMCVRPTLWGLYLVLVPWRIKKRKYSSDVYSFLFVCLSNVLGEHSELDFTITHWSIISDEIQKQ